MNDQINVGDWAIERASPNRPFRVIGFSKGGLWPGMLVDKWGSQHAPALYKKYTGATSPLEAAEAGMDAMIERFPQFTNARNQKVEL